MDLPYHAISEAEADQLDGELQEVLLACGAAPKSNSKKQTTGATAAGRGDLYMADM